jgi:hypothetical protein
MRELIKQFVSHVHAHTPDTAYINIFSTANTQRKLASRSFRIDELDALAAHVEVQVKRRANVFMRVTAINTRLDDTQRGTIDHTVGTSAYYAEIDDNSAETLAQCAQLVPEPSLIVDSGGGLHFYWLLTQLDTDHERIARVNYALKTQIERLTATPTDSVFDTARVLRLPFTQNHKYDPPRIARIVGHIPDEPLRYDPADFQQQAPPQHERAAIALEVAQLPDTFITDIQNDIPELFARVHTAETWQALKSAAYNANGQPDHSKNDYRIAFLMLKHDYSVDEIAAVLTHPVWFSGAKYRRSQRWDYIERTIARAQQAFTVAEEKRSAKKINVSRLVLDLHERHNLCSNNGLLYYYRDGVYHADFNRFIVASALEQLGAQWSYQLRQSYIAYAQDVAMQNVVPMNDVAATHVVTPNGRVCINDGLMYGHDRAYYTTIMSHMYNVSSDTRAIDRFVASILHNDVIDTFWEYVGSCFIFDRYIPKKFLLLTGASNSGKSALLNWIIRFFGRQYVSNVSLHALADSRFAASGLIHKIANVYNDLNSEDANDVGRLKTLTGNDITGFEFKGKDEIFELNRARLFFSMNGYPRLRRQDDAFMNRVLVMECTNTSLHSRQIRYTRK